MDGYLYCGLPEQLTLELQARDPHAKWYVAGGTARSTRDDIRGVIAQCMKTWATVGDVTAEESTEEEANLRVVVASIDGRQGVLADCMLPGPPVQLLRLDQSEMWTIHLGADVSNALIDLYRVMLHEIGHYWGIGHDARGAKSLMAPTYSASIWTPQQWDVSEFQRRYGTPKPRADRVATYMDILDQNHERMKLFKITEEN